MKTRSAALDTLPEPRAFSEAEIEAAIAADPDFPELSDEDLRNAVAVSASGRVKRPISIRLDEEVLDYFQQMGPRYQTRINEVLLDHVRARKSHRRATRRGAVFTSPTLVVPGL